MRGLESVPCLCIKPISHHEWKTTLTNYLRSNFSTLIDMLTSSQIQKTAF